jgi:hypothetical protein
LSVESVSASPVPLAHTIPGVVATTSLSRSLVYEEIRKGHLKVRKCGRRTVVLNDDLRAWLLSLPTSDEAIASSHRTSVSEGP